MTETQETAGGQEEAHEAAEGLAVVPFSELTAKYDIRSQKDSGSDREFFMWDNMFTLNENGQPLPAYTVQETAKLFFGKGPDWLRWRYRPANHYPKGYFVLDDVVLEPKRTETGNRYYTLADIERMAHALVENGAIDGAKFSIVLQLVLLQAVMHRVIEEPVP
jgi:hypothetical protein